MMSFGQLKDVDLFAGFQPDEIEEILDIITLRGYKTGDYLFRPGDPPDHLFLLHLGMVKTYTLSDEGQERVMHIFSSGDAFGGLLFGTRYGELPWAEVLDDSVVSSMDQAAFMRIIQRFPILALNLCRYMAAHHAADMRRMENLIHTKANHRLVLTLLELSKRFGHEHDEFFTLDPWLTHEELANMIGVVRSKVSTLMGELRDAGVLGGHGRRLMVNMAAARVYLLKDGITLEGWMEHQHG